MPALVCLCGQRVEGDGHAALFAALRAHSDAAHADLNITDEQVQEVVATHARMTPWDGQLRRIDSPPDIRRLTPDLLPDFQRFFDHDAFVDNVWWAGCYCMFYNWPGDLESWNGRTGEQNRAAKSELIGRGETHGLLAYVDGKPAAWCHAAPRTTLPLLNRSPDFVVDDDHSTIGSIVCFVVGAPYRRQGVARSLLDAACDLLRDLGMEIAEGYPPRAPDSDARAYHGPLDMFLEARFKPHTVGERYVIVRKSLV